jgi:hypothetical protein
VPQPPGWRAKSIAPHQIGACSRVLTISSAILGLMRVIHLHSFSRQAPTRRLESTSPEIVIVLSGGLYRRFCLGVRVAPGRFRLVD